MSVITALTAQNTLGVTQNNLVNADIVSAQLKSVLSDIIPNAIKIGMLGNGQIAAAVADTLQQYKNTIPIVIDPVLVSTSGKTLLDEDGIRVLTEQLFPMATLITPNIPESEYLCNRIFNALPKDCNREDMKTNSENTLQSNPCSITNADDMIKAAQIMYRHYGCAILLKGGHAAGNADDLLYDGTVHWFHASRINCANTHGTGCTLSSAIASALCLSKTLLDAVHSAKEYVRGAMSTGLDLGHGNGPLNHCWNISK